MFDDGNFHVFLLEKCLKNVYFFSIRVKLGRKRFANGKKIIIKEGVVLKQIMNFVFLKVCNCASLSVTGLQFLE